MLGDGSVAIHWRTMTCDDVVVSCVGHSYASVAAVVMEYMGGKRHWLLPDEIYVALLKKVNVVQTMSYVNL